MKKQLMLLLICICTGVIYAQKPITGTWEGKINVGSASVRAVFHFKKQDDSNYSCLMDSPDQGVMGISCDKVMTSGDSIDINITLAHAGFKGLRVTDSTINGNWEQGGMKIPLVLKKSKDVPEMIHPKPAGQLKKIAGIWEGKIGAGGPSAIRVVFHLERQVDSSYKGSMDSPDQGKMDIPFNNVMINGDSIIVQVIGGRAGFKGLFINDSTINSNWEQGGMQIPLLLKKVQVASKLNRPQTPRPPFNYNSEDVEYDNADKTIHYGATFTYPKGGGTFPTAILITGSGQEDRDETIFGHKPFAVIADYLTKRGIAVLRVDDRGMGKSTGDVENATSADFAKDVETGLTYLRSRKEVDKKRMGMIGHSEGGLIASIVAAGNPDIYFVIMLAGPGIKGSDLLLFQSEAVMKSDSIPDDAINAYGILYKKIDEDIMTEKDSIALYNKLMADFTQWKKNQPKTILDDLNTGTDDKKIIGEFVKGSSSPWMKYFMKSDPRPLIEKFSCKVLAIDGSKDIQVTEPVNLDAIHKALEKSKSPSFETKELPGLNHLFQHCQKCTVEEYGELEETFAPEALELMGQWLDENVKNTEK